MVNFMLIALWIFILRWKEYGSPLVAGIKALVSTTQIPLAWEPQEGTGHPSADNRRCAHTTLTDLQVFKIIFSGYFKLSVKCSYKRIAEKLKFSDFDNSCREN